MATTQQLLDRNSNLNSLSQQLASIRQTLQDEATLIGSYADDDPIPKEFTGIASKYRYRQQSGGLSTHNFQLQVAKDLVLMVKVPERNFNTWLRTLPSLKVKSIGQLINGKKLTVRRNGEIMYPISLEESKEFYRNTDRNGDALFLNARVIDRSERTEGTITSRDGNQVIVEFDNGVRRNYTGDGLELVA